jgi:GH15 family glucan-1,4-alpha-glucosidase
MGPQSSPRFPPHVLREYALLADGERGAVLGPRGEIVWMCLPRWDSDAIFSALIGGESGYAISPVGRYVWGGYYEQDTLIWRGRWATEAGVLECRDALAFPGEPDRAVLLRRVCAVDAPARLRVTLRPGAGFDACPMEQLQCADGIWSARSGPVRLRWQGAAAARVLEHGRALGFELALAAGEQHEFVLELSDRPLPERPADAATAWAATERAWQAAVPALEGVLAPRETRHSYAVLRALTSGSGGMVAAATTSLPERAEAGRNFDYRYVWTRDQCYAAQAVAACEVYPLLDDAVRFTTARVLEHGDRLAPAYTTLGGAIPDQRDLSLPGYPGAGSKVGNHVNRQFQLDTFGEALLLFATAARADRLDADGRRAADLTIDAIESRWQQPDAGIWEIDERLWTHSRLVCVAGLRAIAAAPAPSPRARECSALAEHILSRTAAQATHPNGHWQRSPEDPFLDAALLLPPLRDTAQAGDPRTAPTLEAFERELTRDGFAYRFRHDERPLPAAEGAFVLCGFAMALATHQQGRERDAMGWFERTRAACGPPVLYTEEFDVDEHQLRGNLPQAFVHAMMIEASARLAAPVSPARRVAG